MKRILVTGAQGLVGHAVTRDLLAQGFSVRAVARRTDELQQLNAGAGVLEILQADLLADSECRRVVAGVDAVIHCAAATDVSSPWEQLYEANVTLVRRLAMEAVAAGVRRFVHLSSAAIYDKRRGRVDEAATPKPVTPYERTKAEAEQVLKAALAGTATDYVIVRPSMIYGPRSRTMGGKLFAYVPIVHDLLGSVPRLKGSARFNWVHVDDVARATVALLGTPEAAGHVFNVAEPAVHELGEVVTALANAFGYARGDTLKVSGWLAGLTSTLVGKNPVVLRLLSALLENTWGELQFEHSLRAALDPSLDGDLFHYLGVDFEIDSAKLKSLGFEYRSQSIVRAIPEVLTWYREQRWSPTKVKPDAPRSSPGAGFQFDEVMTGSWRRLKSEKDLPLQFSISSVAPNLKEFLVKGLMTSEGWISAGSLARQQPCKGTLSMPVRTRFVHLDLAFQGDDGNPYRLVAMKKLTALNLVTDITTFVGRLYDANGREIGNGIARFDLKRDLVKLLQSLRFVGVTGKSGGWLSTPSTPSATVPAEGRDTVLPLEVSGFPETVTRA